MYTVYVYMYTEYMYIFILNNEYLKVGKQNHIYILMYLWAVC